MAARMDECTRRFVVSGLHAAASLCALGGPVLAAPAAADSQSQITQLAARFAALRVRGRKLAERREMPAEAAADNAAARAIAGANSVKVVQELLAGPFLSGRDFEITFPFDQAAIEPEALDVLRQAAILAKGISDLRVLVTGSARASEDAPELLARRRATAVAEALVDDDAPADSLEVSDAGAPGRMFGNVVIAVRF